MMTLMEHLESFNRKERFFLVGNALGNPDFQLSTDFQTKLNTAFGIQPPNSAFVAMDYHLDWLHASPFLALPALPAPASCMTRTLRSSRMARHKHLGSLATLAKEP